MRKAIFFALLGLAAGPACVWAQSGSNSQGGASQTASQASAGAGQASGASSSGSLADAARKAREQKKETKPAKVFTNDDLPKSGGISTVGAAAPDASANPAAGQNAAPAGPSDSSKSSGTANDEKTWRARFAQLHGKLDKDKTELDVLQRELNTAAVQFYGGDPQKAYQDQTAGQPQGSAYAKKQAEIDAKQKQVEADQQAIDDAEDELRKSGGDVGWAR